MDLALFDFDGTISDREMFAIYLVQAATPRRLGADATVALDEAA